MRRHIMVGAGAAFLLIIIYTVLIGLAQDWTHVWQQTTDLWYWVLALSGGFGIQAGLFSLWNVNQVKKGAMVSAALALVAMFLLTS